MKSTDLKKYLLPVLAIAILVVLSIVFHYQVHIEDVLTKQPAEGFGVHLSPWRIALEPFIGWMFFFLRADQPLVEIVVLMLWAMLLALPMALLQKTGQRTGIRLKRWLVTLPVILTLTITIIVALVFFPWPDSTIVNHTPDRILVNTHSHTWYSHDGMASPQRVMAWHRRNGYEAFFLTEHNHHGNTLKLLEQQRQGNLPPTPLMLCGQEYSGSNHILLLGLTRDFISKDMPDSTSMDSAQAQNGVAVVAHWFADKHRSVQYYIDNGAQGYEIANHAEGIRVEQEDFNAMVAPCLERNLLMLGGADYHGYGSVAFTWNAMTMPGWRQLDAEQQRTAIMNILRRQEQSKIIVLALRDRQTFPRHLVWLSPVLTLVGYWRSLNAAQLGSWLVWLILLWRLMQNHHIRALSVKIFNHPIKFWAGATLAGALLIGVTGLTLWLQSRSLLEYNHTLREYGGYFMLFAALAAVWAVAMLRRAGKK